MEIAGANPEWAVGFEDECWWSRLALPTLSTPGAQMARRSASSSGLSPKTTLSRKPSPAMDSTQDS